MTFVSYVIFIDEILDSTVLNNACADRTSGAIKFGSGVNIRLPDVVLRATPPNLFVTSKRNVRWLQVTIQRIIPFPRQIGFQGFQIVKAGQNLLPYAIWASGS